MLGRKRTSVQLGRRSMWTDRRVLNAFVREVAGVPELVDRISGRSQPWHSPRPGRGAQSKRAAFPAPAPSDSARTDSV